MGADLVRPTLTVPTVNGGLERSNHGKSTHRLAQFGSACTTGYWPNAARAIERDQDSEQAIEHAAVEAMIPLLAVCFDETDPDDASRPRRAEERRLIRQFAIGLEGERGGLQ